MQHIIQKLSETLRSGVPCVLLTVTERHGSAPRGLGASMFVTREGAQFGTIGGGAVEYAASEHAKAVLHTQSSETKLYRLTQNEVADLGMICGGQVKVLFQYLAADAANQALFAALAEAKRDGRRACLQRVVTDGAVTDMRLVTEGKLPARAAWTEDGALLEPVGQAERVYLFGGGHVSQKLAPVLGYVHFSVHVLEDRAAFADKQLFPTAESTRVIAFDDITDVDIAASDYVVIMTRGHQADYEILRQALKTEASYIGCIGSRHKIALTKKRLTEDGFTEADFARVHTPIGLPIAAETPEEIAVSIAAELIEHRAKHG